MAAFPFLERLWLQSDLQHSAADFFGHRYGPLNMGQKGEDMQYNCAELSLTAAPALTPFLRDRH